MAGDTLREQRALGSWSSLRTTGAQIGRTIWRILQLWRMYAVLDLAFLAADAKLALVYLSADLITSVASVTGMLLLAERFAGIGPWSQNEVIFLLGYATLVGGLVNTFFGYNVLMISRRVGRGQFDHTLIQPQPLLLSLLTEGFTPFSGSAMLLPGFGLLIWSIFGLQLHITAGWLFILALNLLASCATMLAFSFAWGSIAFWAPRAAEEISSAAISSLDQLKPFPLDGIGALLLGALLTFMPVGFVAWYPARALLGIDATPWSAWITPVAAFIFCLFATFCFRKGMHHYARIGSQRYSDFGHRR